MLKIGTAENRPTKSSRTGLVLATVILSMPLGCARAARSATETPAEQQVEGETATDQTTLTVGLYPYVPRLDQFRTAISDAWASVHPEVALKFDESWDGGYSGNPTGLDVFVFDAIYLGDFSNKGLLSPFSAAEVPSVDDFLPYAIDGVKVDSGFLALPMLGCANILFYRSGDDEMAEVTTLDGVEKAIGRCTYTSQVPPDRRGLLMDLAGGTTNACMYVDATESLEGTWPVPLSDPSHLDPNAIGSMSDLLSVSSYYNATQEPDNGSYGRAKWFSEGEGRILMSFTEAMSAMDDETRSQIEFKLFPLGNDPKAQPLFYSDVIAVGSMSSERSLAVELAQLMASTDVLVASMAGSGEIPPQYLMPVRPSIFEILAADDPLYKKMQTMVEASNPILFNLGEGGQEWVNSTKQAIIEESRSDYTCGCDQEANAGSQEEASQVCPQVCQNYGGWNGQWTNYPPGATDKWPGACGCKSCPVE